MSDVSPYVSCEARVPLDHPLRPLRAIIDEAIEVLNQRRAPLPSTAGLRGEAVLRAALFQIIHGIRGDRLLVERMDYDLLLRWFAGLPFEAPTWTADGYEAARAALMADMAAPYLLSAVLAQPRVRQLLRDERLAPDLALLTHWERGAPPAPPTLVADPPEPPRARVSASGWVDPPPPPRRMG